jgi:hypothetical protein
VIRLPVVRASPLSSRDPVPSWHEGPDWVAAVAALAVSTLGLVLAGSVFAQEYAAAQAHVSILIGALALALVCALVLVMGLGEIRYELRIRSQDGEIRVERRTLAGRCAWHEPAAAYRGLIVFDRARRLFVRNQGRPPTGRRGQVSEFVIVLRHDSDHGRDLELFRAQPSLQTLRTMHGLNAAAGGSARTLAARACEERAGDYRDALVGLARDLKVPVMMGAGPDSRPVDVEQLDIWLEPPESPGNDAVLGA